MERSGSVVRPSCMFPACALALHCIHAPVSATLEETVREYGEISERIRNAEGHGRRNKPDSLNRERRALVSFLPIAITRSAKVPTRGGS